MYVKLFNNVKHQSLFVHVLYYNCYTLIYAGHVIHGHVIHGRLVTGTFGAKIQNSVNVQSCSSVTDVGCGIRRRGGANRNEHKSFTSPKARTEQTSLSLLDVLYKAIYYMS